MDEDDSGILNMVIKYVCITNTLVQTFAVRISSLKTVLRCLRKLQVL